MDGADDQLLISDADRHVVIDVLRTSVGEGRITLDEFADRVGEVWAARTSADLQQATRQLPVLAPMPNAPAPMPMSTGAGQVVPTTAPPRRFTEWTVAILSGHERKGRWRVRGSTNAFALMGGCKLDLRGAEVEGNELVITAVSIMGGIDVIVPEGIPVEMTGLALLGGKECKLADVPAIPGAPVIRVRGFTLMGSVSVRSKRDVQVEKQERALRRAERDRLKAERARRRDGHELATPATPEPPAPGTPRPASPPPTAPPAAAAPAPGLPGAARAPGIPIAPDGTVTILFSDIEGFTAMNQRLGDLRAREVLTRHNDLVRREVAGCGGYEVKAQGDGFMVAFAGAAKALRCASGVQRALEQDAQDHPESAVRVRIGLHTGEALRIDDDFHGSAVNMAARIAAAASGGEVLVSSLLRELTEGTGEFSFGEPRLVSLKGFDGERTVYPLRWAPSGAA